MNKENKDVITKELYALAKMFNLWQEKTNKFLEECKKAMLSIAEALTEDEG